MHKEIPPYSAMVARTTQNPTVRVKPASEPKVKLTESELEAIAPASYTGKIIECGIKNVTDGIGDHYKINTRYDYKIEGYRAEDNRTDDDVISIWQPSQPVFISAQTGFGKNYFIENALLPYIRELNHKQGTRQKVLILSNRIALTIQMKDRLKQGHLYQDDDLDKEYSYSEYKNILGSEYATVLSYQGFLSRLGKLRHEQGFRMNKNGKLKMKKQPMYLYVICDESHFFTSDSTFNPDTDRILSQITRIFTHAVRVYMTATPYECIEHIMRHEGDAANPDYAIPIFYGFKRDYSYLLTKSYSNVEELYEIIENSGKQNWLIFIDNIKKGEALKEMLESKITSLKGKVYAVNADSKNDENYQKMVIEEHINVTLKTKKKKETNDEGDKDNKMRVLIATSVIDNGVNFRNIHNVVVSDISRVKVLQMVGRARVDRDKDKQVTLYIKRFNKGEISSKIEQLKKLQDFYYDFKTSNSGNASWFKEKYILRSHKNNIQLDHWIGLDKETGTRSSEYLINMIADSLVNSLVPKYEAILEDILEEEQSDVTPGQKYLEQMLSWFEHVYDTNNDISFRDKEEGKKKIVEFLELYVGGCIGIAKSDQVSEFRKKFTMLYDSYYERKEKDKNGLDYGKKSINEKLAELGILYFISSPTIAYQGKKCAAWHIDCQGDSSIE